MIKIYVKYKQLILYGFFGGLTTFLNIIVFWLLADIFNINYLLSNALAWLSGVFFAYLTNRVWVFESSVTGKKNILLEGLSFFSCRFLTGIMDMFLMYLFITVCGINSLASKIVVNILVIIVNYVLSKLVIFKNKNTKEV